MKKTAIVTGGGRGIGFAIARRLGQDGYNVTVMAVSPQQSHADHLDLLTRDGTDWLYVQGDVAVAEDRRRLVEETVGRYGAIHLLVNNAGVAPQARADLLEMTEESFDRVVAVNTKGALFTAQAVARQMLKQEMAGKKRGTIINVTSCSAEVVSANRGEYCVSKAGAAMVTQLFADRLAGEGILVHEVRPGVIATDMTAGVQEKYDGIIAAGAFPIARWGTPEDVANAVAALAGDDFLYTTGNYIDVDGGFHIRRL